MSDPVDLMKPWTIKSVSTQTQATVLAAARRENLTVGQWLEKRVGEWETSGSPEPRDLPPPPDLPALLTAAGALAAHARLPGEVRSLINQMARDAQGLPRRKPGKLNGHATPALIETAADEGADTKTPASPG
jgi:hypothetical protein